MKPKPMPSVEILKTYLAICKTSPSGLIWIKRPKQSRVKVGDVAGRKHHLGYWQVKFKGKLYLTHRVVYVLKTGLDLLELPIDHPVSREDNINTRLATYSQNGYNRRKQKTYKDVQATSKYKGVCFNKNINKWQASICFNKRSIYLGLFEKEIDAAIAYNKAAENYFKEFALLNQIQQ